MDQAATDQPRAVFRSDDPDVNVYRLMTALVVPRPIAWVSSLSAAGVGNLAPHSFFTVSCARPPIVQFTSVGDKDTLANVLATGEFVVNVASRPMMDLVNDSSASFDPGVDEAEALGIETEPSELVAPAPGRRLAGVDRVHAALDARARRLDDRPRRRRRDHRPQGGAGRGTPGDGAPAARLAAGARRVGPAAGGRVRTPPVLSGVQAPSHRSGSMVTPARAARP